MPRILSGVWYSARSFSRTPGLTLSLLVTIALGTGSSVAIQGFVRGLSPRDYPLRDPRRVVSLFSRNEGNGAGPLTYADFNALRKQSARFEWIGAARLTQASVTLAGQPRLVTIGAVTPELAVLLEIPLKGGVVLSHHTWQNEYSSKPDARGERLRLNRADFHIDGIAPDWLEGIYRGQPVDLWIPLDVETLRSGGGNLWGVGRLRSNEPVDRIEIGGILLRPYTGAPPDMGEGLARVNTLLSLAAAAIFCIAAVNVVTLLLGRASARSQETSLRIALGARASQLVGDLLSDSIVLSVVGGAGGLILALWTSKVVPALLFEQDASFLIFAPQLSTVVATSAVCAGITIACGLLPAVAIPQDRPAAVLRTEGSGPSRTVCLLRSVLVVAEMTLCFLLLVSTAYLSDSLRNALRTSVGRHLGHTVVASLEAGPTAGIRYFQAAESAVHAVPGVSGGVWTGRLPGGQPIWRSFRIEKRQPAFRQVPLEINWFDDGSLSRFVLPPAAGRLFGFGDQLCRTAVVNESAARLLFGVETVGRSILDPARRPVEIIGVVAERAARSRPSIYFYAEQPGAARTPMPAAVFQVPTLQELPVAELDANVVSPGYFETMGLPIVAGQGFSTPHQTGACRIGIVNQEAAGLYFDGDPVGSAVIDDSGRRTTIVGVVHSAPLATFQRRVEAAIYFPMTQYCLPQMTLLVDASDTSASTLTSMRRTMEGVPGRGSNPPLVKTLETHLNQTALAPQRIATTILTASASIALLLSILGLYGVLSDFARHRRRELALRIALGARPRHVVAFVLKEGMRHACMSAVAGVLATLLFLKFLAQFAPGGAAPSLWIWLASPLVLFAAVFLAGALPARRALKADPLTIMRDA